MKKLLIAAMVAAAAAGGIVGYHQAQRASHQELSALMLANIEALSSTENEQGFDKACGGKGDGCVLSGGYWFPDLKGYQ